MSGTLVPSAAAATGPGRAGTVPPRSPMHPLHAPHPTALPLTVMLSAALHLAAVWGILFSPVFRRPEPPREPIKVRLVELPAGLGGLVNTTPGGTLAAPRNVEASAPKTPPKTTLPGKEPTDTHGASPIKDPKAGGAAAGLGHGGPAGLGGKGAGLLLDEPTFQYEWYKARLEDALKSVWRKPVLEGSPSASVHFTISAAGAASEVQIVQSSGNSTFDQSVVRAVYDAAPFPRFPPQYTSDRLGVLYTFELVPPGGR